jgi:hypothetical protein
MTAPTTLPPMIAMVVTGIPLGTGVVTDGRSVTRTGSGVLEGGLGSSGVFVVGTGAGVVVVVGTGSGVVVVGTGSGVVVVGTGTGVVVVGTGSGVVVVGTGSGVVVVGTGTGVVVVGTGSGVVVVGTGTGVVVVGTGSGVVVVGTGSGVVVVGTGTGVVVVGTGTGVVVSSNTYAKTTSLSDTDPIDMSVSLRDLSRFSKLVAANVELVAATVDATSSGGIVIVVPTPVDVVSRRRRSGCSVTEVIRTTAPEMFIARSTLDTYSVRLAAVNSSTRIKSVALNDT